MNSNYINIPALLFSQSSRAGDEAEAIVAKQMADEAALQPLGGESATQKRGVFASLWDATANLKSWLAEPQRALTVSEEAEQVRALARSVSDTDPGFASDLYAAAARHEEKQ